MTDQRTEAPAIVTMTVDGREIEARPGEMIISAAERAGIYIPRFCYHPRLRVVGMCRMCLVQVKGPRGFALQPACFVPVSEGAEVVTTSPEVKKAQDGVLEFLLVNHPLDCPVCDKGGECPLQDQTLAFGPGETRFVEEKRHWEKPIALSDLVEIDRERCIQCDRCTRFADEVAGDALIEFVGRGASIEINTFPDQPFASYFSGNTVQICPVGALLARPYRFRARPWDVEQVESTCTMCAVGCRIAVQSSNDDLTRYLGIDSDPVNQGWLCDKGRFSYEARNDDERLSSPLVERSGQLVEASWPEALDLVAEALADARTAYGAGSVGVIGGARLPNEDAYAWAKLAKGVLGTDNVDAQLGDGLPAEVVLGMPRATIGDAASASSIVLLSPDVKEELPVLYLRLRAAAVDGGVPLIELASRTSGLTRYASSVVPYVPGEAVAAARRVVDEEALRSLAGDRPVVVVGRPSLAEAASSIVEAAAVLRDGLPNVRFLSALRRGNVHGALDMGLAPGVLPGRVALDDGRSSFAAAWPTTPEARGLDAEGILRAVADGELHVLVLLGADPLQDFPDHDLARRALERAPFVVAVDCFLTESSRHADVVLPAATFAERAGTTTNIEGRVTRLGQKVMAPGQAWPDWMIAVELGHRLDADLGFESVDAIWAEVERLAPAYRGVTGDVLASREHRDGVVVPFAGAGHTSYRAGPDVGAGVTAGVDEGVIDPVATPGIEAMEVHAAPVQATGQAGSPLAPDAEEPPNDDGAGEAPTPAPPLLVWDGAPEPSRSPKADAYALRLVVGRKLYDCGVTVQHSASLAPLAAAPVLRVHPADLERLAVKSGGAVRLRSTRLTATVRVETDPNQPRGTAALPFNVGEVDAGTIIEAGAPGNDVVIETP